MEPKSKRNNANEQLLRYLEELQTSKTEVTFKQGQHNSRGLITRIFAGRYRLHVEIGGKSIYATDTCVIQVHPKVEPEKQEYEYDDTGLKEKLRAAGGVE